MNEKTTAENHSENGSVTAIGQQPDYSGRALPNMLRDVFSIYDTPKSLAGWQKERNRTIEELLDIINDDISDTSHPEFSLFAVGNLFTAVAILLSDKFDTILQKTAGKQWKIPPLGGMASPLTNLQINLLYPDQAEYINAGSLLACLIHEKRNGFFRRNHPAVRELDWEDKKCWQRNHNSVGARFGLYGCDDKQIEEIEARLALSHFNIHLTISILAPIDTIAEQVKNIVKAKQDEYLKSQKDDWREELRYDVVDEEFVHMLVEDAHRAFDFSRRKRGDKEIRNKENLTARLRALNFYYYEKHLGLTPKESAYRIQYNPKYKKTNIWVISVSDKEIKRARSFAKRMIQAAVSYRNVLGVPYTENQNSAKSKPPSHQQPRRQRSTS